MPPPAVFISYSHDSDEHKSWVLKLATDLRQNGIDASLDQWDLSPGQDVVTFMQRGIAQSDRVLLVCSQSYVARADAGRGGAGYERLVVTAELVQSIDTKKFLPLVRNNTGDPKTPVFLGPRLFIDFSNDAEYSAKVEELSRELLGAPSSSKPPLGTNPFHGVPPAGESPARAASPAGVTQRGEPVLDEAWFVTHAARAAETIVRNGLIGHMELRFALHDALNKSQLDLLNAVQKSSIRTFGWPVGIVLQNKDEYRPKPTTDGIRAEIAIPEKSLSGRPSYDYWALRTNGDFYLLQSLFEDQRAERKLFFNTRIVRIAEGLLFAANLYDNLGAPPETAISIRVTHRGLANREITSSSPNRDILPGTSHEDASQASFVTTVGGIRPNVVADVRRVAEPLFMLFDFKQFVPSIYEDIVGKFQQGNVT